MSAKLDDELIEGLKQAKKSPRYFALIAKGATPMRLLVQKKKFRDGELLKAKTAAKGNEIITGVIIASGADYAFQVLGEEPIVKPIKVKELIAAQAEMTARPRWEVVTALTEIGDVEQVQDEQESREIPQASIPGALPPQEPMPQQTPATDSQAALSAWQSTRTESIARLREVSSEVAAVNHPESAAALIELKAVIANLTENPDSLQAVKELQRYLRDDDVVLDVCDLAYDIRTPLLAVLSDLQLSLVS